MTVYSVLNVGLVKKCPEQAVSQPLGPRVLAEEKLPADGVSELSQARQFANKEMVSNKECLKEFLQMSFSKSHRGFINNQISLLVVKYHLSSHLNSLTK
jgi:hypothetical protein